MHPVNDQTDYRERQNERDAGCVGLLWGKPSVLQHCNGQNSASRPEKSVEQSNDDSAEKKDSAHLPNKKELSFGYSDPKTALLYN